MPTRDPSTNLEYVKTSQAKKVKYVLGVEELNKIYAVAEQRHRNKLKAKIKTK